MEKGITAHADTSTFRNGNIVTVFPGLSLWATGNSLYNGVPTPTLAGAGLINKALVKALNRLKDQEIHLGNFLAEGQQVVDLIGGTAKTIAKQVSSWRSRNPNKWGLVKQWQRGNLAKDLWHCIPNSWLQMQYGWIPLMSDVEGAANHLARLSLTQKPLIFSKGQAKNEEDVEKPVTARSGFASNSAIATWEMKQAVYVHLVYGLNSPALVQLSQLGLINPAEIVWEITRYSFVVDWFLPLGSWMSSLTANVGYDFVTGTLSRHTKCGYKSSRVKTTSADAQLVRPPGYSGSTVNFVRTCYTSSPVPGLYVKSPISLKHALNGISLLLQAFR